LSPLRPLLLRIRIRLQSHQQAAPHLQRLWLKREKQNKTNKRKTSQPNRFDETKTRQLNPLSTERSARFGVSRRGDAQTTAKQHRQLGRLSQPLVSAVEEEEKR